MTDPRISPAPGETLSTLLHGYRVHARAPRRVVAALTERPRTLRALVQDSGLPRRSVEEILASIGDDLSTGSDGRLVLRNGAVDRYRDLIDYAELRATTSIDPLAAELGRHGALTTTMHELIAAAPRPRADLDHVPATAATVVRRAVWLWTHYDLREARLLCVGDHDLTSLAVILLAAEVTAGGARPGTPRNGGPSVTVVDIDEELLEFLDRSASRHGARVRCRYADLRFGLPPSVAASVDLVFTDPPYTAAGVALFAARGAQALADRERGRVLVAYGYSERAPALGAKVQRALLDQGLVFEAIWPAFHTYDGAEAVGARADMYVCQPTPATWKRLDRPAGREPAPRAIYTHGRQSEESQAAGPPPPILEAAARFLAAGPAGGGDDDGEDTSQNGISRTSAGGVRGGRVGARWVFLGDRPALDAAHARLETVLDRGLPAAVTGSGGPPFVVADLTDDPGPWLTRLLLAVNAARLAVILDAEHPTARPRRGAAAPAGDPGDLGPLAAKWIPSPEHDLVAATAPAPGALVTFAAVDPATLDPAGRLVRWLLDRAHGRLGNVWRDGLIRIAPAAADQSLSQREALAVVRAAVDDPDVLDARLVDLPRHLLATTLATAASTADRPAR